MTAFLNCNMCGISFRGRSDARFCSSACRQKAHRGRTSERIAALGQSRSSGTTKPDVAGTIQRARDEQRRARELCRDALNAQRRAAATQQLLATRKRATATRAPAVPIE